MERPESGVGPTRDFGEEDLQGRVAAILRVAGERRTGIPMADLVELLPEPSPSSVDELRRWLDRRPTLASTVGERVRAPHATDEQTEERRARAVRYREAARSTLDGPLAPVRRWVRVAGVTGSTAYGGPEDGDDIDLFLVARTGSLWLTLAWSFLAFRLRPAPVVDGRPVHLCLNYALDDLQAPVEIATPSDFLDAREALVTDLIVGEAYYRRLLGGAPWIGREIPRLYARRSLPSAVPEPAPAPVAVRLLDALLFPMLSAVAHAVGMVRNHRFRREGREAEAYRTEITFRRFALPNEGYDRLRASYAGASSSPSPAAERTLSPTAGRSGGRPAVGATPALASEI
jgi:hypothetical protein